jgi:hypothetical protein
VTNFDGCRARVRWYARFSHPIPPGWEDSPPNTRVLPSLSLKQELLSANGEKGYPDSISAVSQFQGLFSGTMSGARCSERCFHDEYCTSNPMARNG